MTLPAPAASLSTGGDLHVAQTHAGVDGHDMITINFPLSVCLGCPARPECTTSHQRRRQITVRPRHLHDALQHARAEPTTDAWKATTMNHGLKTRGSRHGDR